MKHYPMKPNVAYYGEHIEVPLEGTNIDLLKKDLTLHNGRVYAYEALGIKNSEPPDIVLYRYSDNRIIVPRHYNIPREESAPKLRIVPVFEPKPHNFKVSCNITPRNWIQEESIDALCKPGDKILCLACGIGKSPCALSAAHKMDKFPVLVVVHTTALLHQWVDRIKEFYVLDHVPIIQGDKGADALKYPISVAMLQTLVSRTYDPEFYEYWNLVIYDELHKLGAYTFSQVCWQFPGDRWGLSATPKRYDGMEQVFHLHMGGISYQYLEQELVPQVSMIDLNTELFGSYYLWNGKPNIPRIITDLAENDYRNGSIISFLETAASYGRKILVLGERLNQLYYLHENSHGIKSKSLCVGAVKPEERKIALTKDVIFASQQIAKEGLDKPDLDTLAILIPFGNEGRLQQSSGRILRDHKGKKSPRILVFYDSSIQIMLAFQRKMKRWFIHNGYTVSEVDHNQTVLPFGNRS